MQHAECKKRQQESIHENIIKVTRFQNRILSTPFVRSSWGLRAIYLEFRIQVPFQQFLATFRPRSSPNQILMFKLSQIFIWLKRSILFFSLEQQFVTLLFIKLGKWCIQKSVLVYLNIYNWSSFRFVHWNLKQLILIMFERLNLMMKK